MPEWIASTESFIQWYTEQEYGDGLFGLRRGHTVFLLRNYAAEVI
jgi:hypothetical protein